MTIETRRIGGVCILDAKGKMIRGNGDIVLRDSFGELLEAGERRFVLDLRRVPFLDSAGLGETVACGKRAAERDGRILLLVKPGSKVEDLIRLTALDRILDLHHEEAEAVAALAD
jgi:anti-sigma B factor antagonist